MDPVYEALVKIVGQGHVSNQPEELFIYSYDLGTTEPHRPDYVVSPRTMEQIQEILRLANREKVPVVPLGGGLSLAGLAVPFKGGIVLDLKRMDSILEVSETARYALVECGVSQGKLTSFLDKYHPTLTHSEPGAPAMATIAGNIAIHGQGDLASPFGFNSDMVNGLEVVLPTGEVCRFGSCSIGASWFTQHPLPDVGLFLGWLGTTGIITKVSLKLYPCKKIRGLGQFVVEDETLVPEIMHKLTHTQMVEDTGATSQAIPPFTSGLHTFNINIAADSEKELEFKHEIIFDDTLGEYIRAGTGGFLGFIRGLQRPIFDKSADYKKGGGFEYIGGIMPIDRYPECYRRGREISEKHDIPYTIVGRCIGAAHAMMFSWSYAFNRADPETIRQSREALHETYALALELGGTIWKPGLYAQKLMLERMDPNTVNLMKKIKQMLDPNGIMNPGNWEVS